LLKNSNQTKDGLSLTAGVTVVGTNYWVVALAMLLSPAPFAVWVICQCEVQVTTYHAPAQAKMSISTIEGLLHHQNSNSVQAGVNARDEEWVEKGVKILMREEAVVSAGSAGGARGKLVGVWRKGLQRQRYGASFVGVYLAQEVRAEALVV
jgi:hypothetical protein